MFLLSKVTFSVYLAGVGAAGGRRHLSLFSNVFRMVMPSNYASQFLSLLPDPSSPTFSAASKGGRIWHTATTAEHFAMNNLPLELIVQISSHLALEDRVRLSKVSRKFHGAVCTVRANVQNAVIVVRTRVVFRRIFCFLLRLEPKCNLIEIWEWHSCGSVMVNEPGRTTSPIHDIMKYYDDPKHGGHMGKCRVHNWYTYYLLLFCACFAHERICIVLRASGPKPIHFPRPV